jgi:hypothetical protein
VRPPRARPGAAAGGGLLAAALLCAGCGTAGAAGGAAAPAISPPAAAPAAAGALSLADSQSTSQAAWAVLPMGAPAGPNEFWQLLRLTPGASGWTVQTPPDVATNGALTLGGMSGTSLVAGVRPSLYLAFSPVSRTTDGGRDWAAGPPAQGLASVPDALAATPDGSGLLSLDRSGQVATAPSDGTRWTAIAAERSLAGTAAGRACGLTRLTAVAFSPAALPLAAGACARPGVAGIFARAGGAWQAAGPPLPAALSGDRVQVLRLAAAAGQTVALLQAGEGTRARLLAAWLGPQGRWDLSPLLAPDGQRVVTTGLGASGALALILSGGRGEIVSGPGGAWQPTPPVPAGRTVVIALPAGGRPVALAATAGTLTAWQLGADPGWTRVQTLKVPIPYGSSL